MPNHKYFRQKFVSMGDDLGWFAILRPTTRWGNPWELDAAEGLLVSGRNVVLSEVSREQMICCIGVKIE